MEILIKLDKRLYKYAKHHTLTSGEIDGICDAIANGNLLPKGHGRLIDADYKVSSDGRTVNSVCGYMAPTIIEKDDEVES